jgi:hypothetical protein
MRADSAAEPRAFHATKSGECDWSPDGKRVLFSSDRSGWIDLWAIRLTDGQPEGAPELMKADLGSVEPLGMTRSGAFYYGTAFRRSSNKIQVASFDFETVSS